MPENADVISYKAAQDQKGARPLDVRSWPELKKELNRCVYGGGEVKELVFSFFRQRSSGPRKMLCLLAPEGMGKRRLIESFCSALGWDLVLLPIGAIQNEAGSHVGNRRADLNAVAGRVLQALPQEAQKPAVVLLENLDRMEAAFFANPSVGFFEVMDYVCDYARKNNYRACDIDYTKTFFAATATHLSTIAPGVLKQMDVATIPSYTEKDKLAIAKGHLIPELCRRWNLAGGFRLSDNTLLRLIREYTFEGGVNALYEKLAAVIRQCSVRFYEENRTTLSVSKNQLEALLGPPPYPAAALEGGVGTVRVLGRSPRGGVVLTMEVLILAGDGRLVLTGNIDEMFRETARVAVDVVRSRAEAFRLPTSFPKKNDVHIHMLKGTTPKHGVSAGVALAAALMSALAGAPVSGDIGFTGEITLHGRITGVGDIRDKILGAERAGLQRVCIPVENRADFERLPKEIRRKIRPIYAERIDTVFSEAMNL